MYVQNYAIFPKTEKQQQQKNPKPAPVFVHRQNNISPRKRSTQTVSVTLLRAYRVFSSIFIFVNKYRLSDQCLVYKANGYSFRVIRIRVDV